MYIFEHRTCIYTYICIYVYIRIFKYMYLYILYTSDETTSLLQGQCMRPPVIRACWLLRPVAASFQTSTTFDASLYTYMYVNMNWKTWSTYCNTWSGCTP